MVYIKMTNDMWILSGLQKLIPQSLIVKLEDVRYIPYVQFKNASKMTENPIHSLLKRQHIISNIELKKIRKQSQLTPQQKKFKQQLKAKHQMRMMNKNFFIKNDTLTTNLNRDAYYFEEKKDQSIKDLSKSLSFGMTFIFSFFMAGLTGYYFGIYFLGLQFTHALIVSMLFIMTTIIIQTLLFIIKQSKDDKLRDKAAKMKAKAPKTFQFSKPTVAPRFGTQTQNKNSSNLTQSNNQKNSSQANIKPKLD